MIKSSKPTAKGGSYSFLFVAILFSFLLLQGCQKETKEEYEEVSALKIESVDGYVGDQNCTECHEQAAADWKNSHHDKAMQVVSENTVLGNFDNQSISLDGVDYLFYRKGNEFHVAIVEIDGSEQDYTVSDVFGIEPLQQYMIDFPKGRKQVLRASWDTEKKVWFHQYAGDQIKVNDWLHWTQGGQNWNTMCAECHSTHLEKNYFVEKDSFSTSYTSINVSCESCHGPGEKHVIWANGPQTDTDGTQVLGNNQTAQVNMCAPCHARRMKLTENLVPNLAFDDQYLIQNISSDFYHLDGQILEEDYVYGSFAQSKMHSLGIKCSDCHNPHSLELKFEGNKLCLQCHVPAQYDSKEHHFHEVATEAGLCVSCHMTGRYYMGNDFRRDHSFRIPRPDQSLVYGTPNACNECHDDQSEKWASDWVVEWYGPERAPHFSDYLLLSHKEDINETDQQKLVKFINDLNYPAIARSTVLNNLRFGGRAEVQATLESLKDSTAYVRYNGLMQFRGIDLQDRQSIAMEHLSDESRLVRIGAAQLLTDFDGAGWNESNRLALGNAKQELEDMLYGNSDFSTGRLQLADYFMQTGDLNSAIEHYSMALKKDSLLFPVYSNLATAYSLNSMPDRALEVLNTWIDFDPDEGRAYYLRGLLNFELGNPEIAVEDLQMAVELNPSDSRAMYNLATYYYQNRNQVQAERYIRRALTVDPENRDFQYLLALVLKEQGKVNASNQIMQQLNS
ncbi:MAG: tetratricopeptide repeat protein [Lutimonas sp.]